MIYYYRFSYPAAYKTIKIIPTFTSCNIKVVNS